jgi:IrrE N-terminal-like domain
MVLRRRFSIAHEIVHTFFYEMRGGCLKPKRQVPRGNRLEGACHKGAALLLVPDRFLPGELQGPGPIGARRIVDLAGKFQVSIEVMLRRLDQLEVFESHRVAPVLVRGFGSEAEIEFSVYPTWLRLFLSKPRRGVGLSSWFLDCGTGIEQKDAIGPKSKEGMVGIGSSGLMRRTRHGILWARRGWRGGAGCIYEIELQQDDSSHGVPAGDA